MSNLNDHAITLLRYMLEEGLIFPKGCPRRELQAAIGLSDNDFDGVENFLLQDHLIEGTGGQDGDRWLTPIGVHYIADELKKREPISLDSERVLRFSILRNSRQ